MADTRYHFYVTPTDMRKGYYSLYGIVQNQMYLNPLSGDVFVFLNRRRTHIKLLVWDGNGLVLYCKRLERGTFSKPPFCSPSISTPLQEADLERILGCFNLRNQKKE